MSSDALKQISSSISKTKNNVKLICGNMDNLDSLVNSEKFDLVSSCFALYYSENIPLLIQKIKNILVSGGRFFVCGPIEGNNTELIKFHSQIPHAKKQNLPFVMSEQILPELENQFKILSKDIFVNPLSFPSVNSLIDYWKSYALYEPHIEEEFIKKAELHFSKNNTFVTNKKILGVVACI